ncbi:hypothetical protein LCGC14_1617650 [marine sediment metagenome]|uniref:Uncharacterized protein n=1 Tax=marine sediment metagenome TaxID=412755 RepID=A0A0F9IT98_9ZZZZ
MVEPESYTCPECGMTSYHPEDVKHEYCANCHKTKRELDFSKMTEGQALYSIGVRVIEKDGKKGINMPIPGKPGESIFVQASDEKPDVIVASDRKQDRVKGAKKVRCADCRRKVWISPSTQVMLKRYPGVPVICIPCFVKRAEKENKKKKEVT